MVRDRVFRVTHAAPRRDRNGLHGFRVGATEHAWRPSPSPRPPSSPTLRERKGEIMPPHPPPPAPLPFSHRERQREGSIAVVILRLRLSTILSPLTSSPLSRSSDHPSRTSTPWGLILSPLTSSPLSRSAGEGLGVRAPHAFPPAPLPFPHRERR